MVADVLYIHFAGLYAHSAVNALAFVKLYAYQRPFVEKAVNCAERTEKSAKETVNEDTADNKEHKQTELPRKQIAQHCKKARIVAVRKQADRALEGAGGADILTERGYAVIDKRYGYYHYGEYYVLQKRHNARVTALFKLRGFDFVQKLLPQTYGAQKSANSPCKR